ncbi:hypothetical protein IVB12_11400 [Bradyrhizobium sp. 179]|uniref:hypothetical protein n=1 Tax=Bradyrhizobium sp. 179 TaxID=2782648 RepID=UPI001FFBF13F|nr:hypothetical protein [Bradyrhizobium sp. 179]MCK1542535.1 hypothetical protein [Bradyrhizobium sp. 179]
MELIRSGSHHVDIAGDGRSCTRQWSTLDRVSARRTTETESAEFLNEVALDLLAQLAHENAPALDVVALIAALELLEQLVVRDDEADTHREHMQQPIPFVSPGSG